MVFAQPPVSCVTLCSFSDLEQMSVFTPRVFWMASAPLFVLWAHSEVFHGLVGLFWLRRGRPLCFFTSEEVILAPIIIPVVITGD